MALTDTPPGVCGAATLFLVSFGFFEFSAAARLHFVPSRGLLQSNASEPNATLFACATDADCAARPSTFCVPVPKNGSLRAEIGLPSAALGVCVLPPTSTSAVKSPLTEQEWKTFVAESYKLFPLTDGTGAASWPAPASRPSSVVGVSSVPGM